ncbi:MULTISPECIES: hypothetical protein [Chryseobacterium]|uniref:hypothetical protein n=1 Tax=Chryseobacterium TaxID=59732 RepID=UPI001BE6FD19|nr:MULTISPECIES: hypothetical protein [Chryseobacterium]MBT2619160.1 hypothetical protein [Chryseobacterium sp. ISL-6]
MNPISKINCTCESPPISYKDYDSYELGTDHTNGRYGEVTIEICRRCKRKWVKYFVEYESFSRSGRWYRGIINDKNIEKITPENAIDYIENMEWYLYGGSYFSHTGAIGKGKVYVDL